MVAAIRNIHWEVGHFVSVKRLKKFDNPTFLCRENERMVLNELTTLIKTTTLEAFS
jgi:hypothetical protein